MIKVHSLFKKGSDGRAIPEINEYCDWVIKGDGIMTIKIDGIDLHLVDGDHKEGYTNGVVPMEVYKRTFRATEKEPALYSKCCPEEVLDMPIIDAYKRALAKKSGWLTEGFYVAYGPNIKGNPQCAKNPGLVKVSPVDSILIVPRNLTIVDRAGGTTVAKLFEQLGKELADSEVEGFVFHLEDKKLNPLALAQVTRKDFGLSWPLAVNASPSVIDVVPAIMG